MIHDVLKESVRELGFNGACFAIYAELEALEDQDPAVVATQAPTADSIHAQLAENAARIARLPPAYLAGALAANASPREIRFGAAGFDTLMRRIHGVDPLDYRPVGPSMIAIVGPAGAGKTTLAKKLADFYGAERRSFAGVLKEMARPLLSAAGLSHDQIERALYGESHERNIDVPIPGTERHFNLRDALRTLGTEWGRDLVDEDLWSAMAVNSALESGSLCVFDDTRFDNEVERVAAAGGVIISIKPPAHIAETPAEHASEVPPWVPEGPTLLFDNSEHNALHFTSSLARLVRELALLGLTGDNTPSS